ncbi:MAG TPA: glycosyltransferase family 87 protein, partial [Tepidisphaeraceae bacterium]
NLAILRPAPLRKRLWQGAAAMGLLLGTLVVGNFVIAPDKSVHAPMLGHDFLAFYTAGTFARLGQFDHLYDLDATREIEHVLAQQNKLETGASFGPFWNPPFYAWPLAALSKLSYTTALIVWTCFNLTCLGVAIVMLARMLPPVVARPPPIMRLADDPVPLKFKRDWRNWALVPMLVLSSMPFVQAISHGQNTFASLLLLTLVVTAWRARMPVAAGLLCGLMLYKPQLAAVVAVMLILSMGSRVCLGLGFVAGSLMLIMGLTMPGVLDNYLTQLPLNLRFMQIDNAYLWERHATLKAFWRMLLQGRGAGEISGVVIVLTTFSGAMIAAGLAGAWWRSRRPDIDDCWTGETRAASRDRLIGATIVAMPLLMPFYFDYDLLLLSVPAVLFAGEMLSKPVGARLGRTERLLAGAWVGLYLWLMINPPIARASAINVTVVLLGTVAGLSIARACRRGARTSSTMALVPEVQHVLVKRAA